MGRVKGSQSGVKPGVGKCTLLGKSHGLVAGEVDGLGKSVRYSLGYGKFIKVGELWSAEGEADGLG